MLVIRRRVGETLLIGDDVEVEVLESGGSQVKLGIRAPRSIGVVRKEIRVVRSQNQEAARPISAPELKQIVKQLKNPIPKPISPL
jgi:carbon storage regulator